MVNACAPYAARVRGRRKPMAQKKDACVVKDTVELFWFVSWFDFCLLFFGVGQGRAGTKITLTTSFVP